MPEPAPPVTRPVPTPTEAIGGDALLHVPPVVALLSIVVDPMQTVVTPVIGPGAAEVTASVIVYTRVHPVIEFLIVKVPV